MKKSSLIFLMFIAFMFSCETKEFEDDNAYIYKVEYLYNRLGLAKIKVYYNFVYNNDTIRETYYARWTIIPQHGDSLLIRFPVNEPQKSKAIKLITKRKVYKGILTGYPNIEEFNKFRKDHPELFSEHPDSVSNIKAAWDAYLKYYGYENKSH